MYFMKRNPDFKFISAFTRFYSLARKNHYDVLNLRRNCSDKEIKDAFIQMSKEFHPDKNKDARAQEKFVRIVEAYNVLGKPCSRAQYDSTFAMESYRTTPYTPYTAYTYKRYNNYGANPQYSNFYQATQGKSKKTNQQAKSHANTTAAVNRKVPNYVIIMVCCGITVVGAILQGFVIREMYMVHRKQTQEKSKRLAEELEKVRGSARSNGNELQTRLLLEKIVAAANPTVATASLGQTLAEEKKGYDVQLVSEDEVADESDWSYNEFILAHLKNFMIADSEDS
ncbi:dnaJ-like protein 60 isoform X2 [Plodia interpunctella]|uniref:dnaJ-like protein 60 isoform X2 n=1 Tax=Plodia interpunctella TaxID=58824 RepID=UPI002368CB4A|nr:dnaJ-like protein 60 isoform X2 [Plodia interpunctella]